MREILCFHRPEEANGYLSNWYLSDFPADGRVFSSMEQYMMYQKTRVFQDGETAAEILAAADAGKIKALGRSVRHYDDTVWNGLRQLIVYDGLLAKFRQNGDLRKRLLETGGAVLAECAVQDRIWGIGLSMKDGRRFSMAEWRGQNLLGFALMRVRERLGEG